MSITLALLFATSAGARESSAPPLPPLPEAPKRQLPQPKADELKQVDALLTGLSSADEATRARAHATIDRVDPAWVPAMARRLRAISESADKLGMKQLLKKVRREARDKLREEMRKAGKKGKVVTPDYLEMLLQAPHPESRDWKHLVWVVGLNRMLTHLKTVEAARELINVYVYFGEFLRADTQLGLARQGEHSVAALIEATRHPAAKIRQWAERRLKLRKKDIPSEVVQTDNVLALADILRAYGSIRDPDNARLLLSFCNSERSQVRLAARQAVGLMGEVAHWTLRDTYERMVGEKPKREWAWERTARELFRELDRIRLAEIYQLLDAGMQAHDEQKWDAMREAFDKLLAKDPLFDRGSELAKPYFDYAMAKLEANAEAAKQALRRAERLNTSRELEDRIRSYLYTLEGEELLEGGIADQMLFRRAVALDNSNERAKERLEEISRAQTRVDARYTRYLAAAGIIVSALIAMLLIVLRRSPSKANVPATPTSVAEAQAPTPAAEAGSTSEPKPEANPPAPDERSPADEPEPEVDSAQQADSPATEDADERKPADS